MGAPVSAWAVPPARGRVNTRAQQIADRHVLSGLRHHAFLGGDNEQDEIDPRRTRYHRANEFLVAGHIDHRDLQSIPEFEYRETEIDRDAPGLLLRQAIGIHSGQGADQARLAVIDVARGSENERRRRGFAASRISGAQ